MDRESNLHSARVDDELAREVQSLVRGAPVEARIEEARAKEDAGDGETVPQSLVDQVSDVEGGDEFDGGLSRGELLARSELGTRLRPSIFPASRADVLTCAAAEHASPEQLGQLQALPEDTYHTVQEVWEALGGKREESSGHVPREDSHDAEIEETPAAVTPARTHFGFRFDPWYRLAARPFGVSPRSASVEIEPGDVGPMLVARFGPWSLTTPLTNVAGTTPTGPYSALKTIGPPHLSLADFGLTFATNGQRGLCIQFHRPVPGIAPTGLVRHPALTVTVEHVEDLARALAT